MKRIVGPEALRTDTGWSKFADDPAAAEIPTPEKLPHPTKVQTLDNDEIASLVSSNPTPEKKERTGEGIVSPNNAGGEIVSPNDAGEGIVSPNDIDSHAARELAFDDPVKSRVAPEGALIDGCLITEATDQQYVSEDAPYQREPCGIAHDDDMSFPAEGYPTDDTAAMQCPLEPTPLDHENCEPVVHSFEDGMDLTPNHEFASKDDVKNMVKLASARVGFLPIVAYSDKKRIGFRCSDKCCSWSIRAVRMVGCDKFQLRVHNSAHTCSPASLGGRKQTVGAKVVANLLKDAFPGRHTIPTKEVRYLANRNSLHPLYHTVWRATKIVAASIFGSPEESFINLHKYLYALRYANPGMNTVLKTEEDGATFKYVFIAPKQCIDGFTYMRKVISVDGAHLGSKYRGKLLMATGKDGDKHPYPLAWAIVDGETEDAWTWFFTNLVALIPDSSELVIVSDRAQSIINAVRKVYPSAKHGYCVWHISQNLKKYLSKRGRVLTTDKADEITGNFDVIARAYTVSEFDRLYATFKLANPHAVAYLERSLEQEKWARCHFEGARYDVMTTNGSECMNGQLKDARSYTILSLNDAIMDLLADWFNTRRNASCSIRHGGQQNLTPAVEKILHDRKIRALKHDVREVHSFRAEYWVDGCSVDLINKTCTCRVFDIDGIPCEHAIAAYLSIEGNRNIHTLCSKYYLRDFWALSYLGSINRVPPMEQWSIPEDIANKELLPPKPNSKRGRPQRTRLPSDGEFGKRRRSSTNRSQKSSSSPSVNC